MSGKIKYSFEKEKGKISYQYNFEILCDTLSDFGRELIKFVEQNSESKFLEHLIKHSKDYDSIAEILFSRNLVGRIRAAYEKICDKNLEEDIQFGNVMASKIGNNAFVLSPNILSELQPKEFALLLGMINIPFEHQLDAIGFNITSNSNVDCKIDYEFMPSLEPLRTYPFDS